MGPDKPGDQDLRYWEWGQNSMYSKQKKTTEW